MVRDAERGQAHTVEAFVAALLLVSGLVFALQATAVTPLSASTSNQHIENQQRAAANDVLAIAAAEGDLKAAVLCWNPNGNETFVNASTETGAYLSGGEQAAAGCGQFGRQLAETFGDRSVAYSVRVVYHNATGVVKTQPMIDMGDPSDSAVTASRTVAIYPDDRLGPDGEGQPVSEATLYGEDDPDWMAYPTQIEVEVTVWRM
ncbi:MAG: DUF7288 family protein [Halobacteriota archaeon]